MTRKIVAIICIFIIQVNVFAQKTDIDSLEKLLETYLQDDTTRVNILNSLAHKTYRKNINRSFMLALKADSISQVLNYKKGKAISLKIQGIYYRRNSDLTKALDCFNQSIDILQEFNLDGEIAECKKNIGLIHRYKGDYKKSLELLNQALLYEIKHNHSKEISICYNIMGDVYKAQGDYLKAIECYENSNIQIEKMEDYHGTAVCFNSIGAIYTLLGEYNEALLYHQKALKIEKKIDHKLGISYCYTYMGDIYRRKNELDIATDYYQKARLLVEEINNKIRLIEVHSEIGKIYNLQNKYQKALNCFIKAKEISIEAERSTNEYWSYQQLANVYFKLGNIDKALLYSKKAYGFAKQTGEALLIKESSQILALALAKKGNFKQAFNYHIEYKLMNDSLLNEDNIRKIVSTKLQHQYEKEKQKQEFEKKRLDELHENETKRMAIIRNTLIIILLLLFVLIFFIFRSYKIKNKANKKLEKQKNEIEIAYENIALLSDIGKKITSNLSADKIIITIYHQINQLMDATTFDIGIYNSTKDTLDFFGGIEKGKVLPLVSVAVDDLSLATICFNKQLEIIINNNEEYEKFLEKKIARVGDITSSIIYMPLTINDKQLGVITVQSFQDNAYSQQETDFLRNIAIYASIALENAQIYKQLERQKDELSEKNSILSKQKEEIVTFNEELNAVNEEIMAQRDHLKDLNEKLVYKNEEINTQREEIQKHKEDIEGKNSEIIGSISYARYIQTCVLPNLENGIAFFDDIFVIYRPLAIVSGDFYWYYHIATQNKLFVALVDCTGHGVPGGFMSMIGNLLLNEIIKKNEIYTPSEILNTLETSIIKTLKQEYTQNQDGMDMSICAFEQFSDKLKVIYSGARSPIFYYDSKKEIIKKIKPDRHSIGGVFNWQKSFSDKEFIMNQGDSIYFSSDGIIHQNNFKRKKFGTPGFTKALSECATMNMLKQKKYIENKLDTFSENEPQRDDIAVLGLKYI